MSSPSARCNRRESLVAAAGVAGAIVAYHTAQAARPAGRIRVGQIGTAHGHATKIAVYRNSPDYEVVGIAEPDEKLQAAAKSQPAFRDLDWLTVEQLLAIDGLDVVLIETRTKHSLDYAEQCIRAGKHVHLDKPAGESLEQFERILQDAAARKLVVQMGYMYRYNPAWLLLKDFHSRGWLGEIFEVHAVMSKQIGDAERIGLSQYRGGMMFELGCHLIDLVVDLLGEPAKVTGYGLHSGHQGDTLRDNMLAVLEYPKAIASIKSSALEVEGFARRHLCVCGTEGSLHIQPLDRPKVQLAFSTPRDKYIRGYQEVTFPQPFERYVADAAEMAKVLRGEQENRYPYAHDLLVQRTVLNACR